MRALGGGIASVRTTRGARAAAGRGTQQQVSVLVANTAKAVPSTVVDTSPTVGPNPMSLGDGTEIDEGTMDTPFSDDDSANIAAEMVP